MDEAIKLKKQFLSGFRERLAMQKKNVLDTPLHLRNIPIQTMQDKEELWSKELAQFTPADRETGMFNRPMFSYFHNVLCSLTDT